MSQPPAWCAEYVGIPYADAGRDPNTGLDCWGLLVHVMRKQFGIQAPWYLGKRWEGTRQSSKTLGEFIVGESHKWTLVWAKQDRNDTIPEGLDIRPGDGLLIRMDGVPMHVGVVAQNPWFLHTERDMDCCLDDLTSSRWTRRILGVYRYEAGDAVAESGDRGGGSV